MGTLGRGARNGKKPAPRTAKARGKSPSRGAGAGAQSVGRTMAQADAIEQNKAITDILRVIGSSPGELQPVFDTILSHAMRLCDAGLGTVGLYDGKHYRHVAQRGGTAEYAKWLFSEPFKPGPKSTLGRMIVQRLPFHAPDYRELPEFRERKPRAVATVELGGARTYLAVPLLKDGRVIGAITIRRAEVRPFTKKQIDLVSTFASQAVIAVENARLFNETREALEQQTATAEILRVITSSPTDLTPVMAAVVENAARLADADHALIGQAEGGNLRWLAAYGCALPGGTRPITRDVPSGRAMLDLQTTQVEDVAQLNDPAVERAYRELGVRSIFATPLVREGRAIGVLLLRRTTVRPFTDKHMALLRTFADQAAIAIENVRLFNETKEALEQQTATSEILRVISSTPTDVQPVFAAIVENARRLMSARNAVVLLRRDSDFIVAGYSAAAPAPSLDELPAEVRTAPLDRDKNFASRAILDGEVIHVPDWEADDVIEFERLVAKAYGIGSGVILPLLRHGRGIGALAVTRATKGPFHEKEIALLRSFADQAVIAIENVRLFNETKEALEQQTAISEVLRVISSSPADVKPVLEAVAERAAKICDAVDAQIFLREGDDMKHVARFGPFPIGIELGNARPLSRGWVAGRAVLEGKAIHIEDLLAVPREEYPVSHELRDRAGHRTLLSVPLMRERRALGAISLRRMEVRPFTEKQIALLQTFADQGAIAIQNARLFREIQEKSAQLEVANKHKSDFLANMSHELRTPLNAIIGFSEALTDRLFGEINEKQAEYLKDIHESGRHLLSLINDILDLSKIEAGRMDLEVSTFHLPTALSNAMTLIRERAQRHGIELGLDVDQRLGEFQADERKFKQIMLNLLSNAVKFTPDGGRVDVSAKKDTDKIEIAVKDTGIGIAPEDQVAVFEEFKQVGRDQLRKAEGTGLGLALTRRFVELHGGAIRLESTPGKGSVFSFTLPVRR